MARFDGIDFTDPRHDGLGGDIPNGVAQVLLSPLSMSASGQIIISGIMAVSLSHIVAAGSGEAAALDQPVFDGIDFGDNRHTGLGGVDPGVLNGVASIVLGSLQAQGYGEAVGGTIEGQGSIEIGPISVTAVGSTVQAQVMIPIPGRTVRYPFPRHDERVIDEAVENVIIEGVGNIVLTAPVAEASGMVVIPAINGTGSASIGSVTIAASGDIDTTIIDEDEEITLLIAALFARGRAA